MEAEESKLDERPGLAALWTRHSEWVDASRGADQGPRGTDTNDVDRWTCPLDGMSLRNVGTGEIRKMDCKRWACIEHGPLLGWRWSQRIMGVPWTKMITLTAVPDDRKEAARAWDKMVRWLKLRGVRTYLRVMELGSAHGMRHWHILVDGTSSIPQVELSGYAARCGLGYITWISKVRERSGAVWYLLGYVFKSLGVSDERQRGWRKVTVSRNIPNWERVLEARHDIPSADGNAADWAVVSGPNESLYHAYLDSDVMRPWKEGNADQFEPGRRGDGKATGVAKTPGARGAEPEGDRVRERGADTIVGEQALGVDYASGGGAAED